MMIYRLPQRKESVSRQRIDKALHRSFINGIINKNASVPQNISVVMWQVRRALALVLVVP